MNIHSQKISQELSLPLSGVNAVLDLLGTGATIPFIARYRKEATGSLDEVAIAAIRDRSTQLEDLDKRMEAVLKSVREQGKLSEALELQIRNARTMLELEDIYMPYKPKRRTKGIIAREKGLEPLALLIFNQADVDLAVESGRYIDVSKEVNSAEEALAGARDIVAEWINENQQARSRMRELFRSQASLKSKVIAGKELEGQKFKDYFDWEEPISKAPSHRVLAMRRGEKELVLMLDILPPEENAIAMLESVFINRKNEASAQVRLAIKDSYKRLMRPSIETEIRLLTKGEADKEAIKVFSDNLRQLLLASPMGLKNVLAIDPGFRTGCKVVCLDRQGKLLENTSIFPHEPQRKTAESGHTLMHLIKKHSIEAIAIGNGTAGRETEAFVRSLMLDASIQVVMVNESGASVYSASEAAREEFADYDITVRGAVSIGRRLMDPLAELVKIDPKSIGVGQYQHDVDQSMLRQSLDDVVMSCVNAVGVEVNTASKQLLTYVSGLGPQLAQNIIEYRNTNGSFKNREALKRVPRMGEKAFEQAAGFLRINSPENPLDASAVHPESYGVVSKMAADLGCKVEALLKEDALRKQIKLLNYVTEKTGLPTLSDIVQELAKPGRDPREKFEAFSFTEGVSDIADLRVGMKLPGIVTNVTKFGAFIDIGVHQDGLVHISHLADKFISDPNQEVKVQQRVMVTVLEVDAQRKRISLSMKTGAPDHKASGKEEKKTKKEDMPNKLNQLADKFNSIKK